MLGFVGGSAAGFVIIFLVFGGWPPRVSAVTRGNPTAPQWLPGSSLPLKPLPGLIARMETIEGSFISPDDTCEATTHTICGYLAAHYSTVTGEILRLVYGVWPAPCITQRAVEEMFAEEGGPMYILELTRYPDSGSYGLQRFHPGSDIYPSHWREIAGWGNVRELTVHFSDDDTDPDHRDEESDQNERWWERNRRILDIDSLPDAIQEM